MLCITGNEGRDKGYNELSLVKLWIGVSTLLKPDSVLAISAGCRGFLAIQDWLTSYHHELLELFSPPKLRLPSYSTIRRVLLDLDTPVRKTESHPAIQLVTVYVVERGLILPIQPVESKSNEQLVDPFANFSMSSRLECSQPGELPDADQLNLN